MTQKLLDGTAFGLGLGIVFSAWATLVRIVLGPGAFEDASYPVVVTVYLLGGSLGGTLLGLFLRFRDRLWGNVLMGISLVFPIYLGFFLVHGYQGERLTPAIGLASLLPATLVGGLFGVEMWLERARKKRVQPFPWVTSRRLVGTWVLALAISMVGYFGLSQFTSAWSFLALLWMTLLFFIAPLLVALLLTMDWLRQRRAPVVRAGGG